MKTKIRNLLIVAILLIMLAIVLIAYWVIYLNNVHSTFDNYYKFRGCKELLERGDNYGICKTYSGDIITIVKYENKWYLQGDLPVKCFWFINCP